MNMKQRQREALTKERRHRLATRGGPSSSNVVIDPGINGINDAIDSDSFLGIVVNS